MSLFDTVREMDETEEWANDFDDLDDADMDTIFERHEGDAREVTRETIDLAHEQEVIGDDTHQQVMEVLDNWQSSSTLDQVTALRVKMVLDGYARQRSSVTEMKGRLIDKAEEAMENGDIDAAEGLLDRAENLPGVEEMDLRDGDDRDLGAFFG